MFPQEASLCLVPGTDRLVGMMFVKDTTKLPVGVACAHEDTHGVVDSDGWESDNVEVRTVLLFVPGSSRITSAAV